MCAPLLPAAVLCILKAVVVAERSGELRIHHR